jgi:hypothetical protein
MSAKGLAGATGPSSDRPMPAAALTPAVAAPVALDRPPSKLRRYARQLAPYVITGAVIVAILLKYELREIVAKMADGNVAPMAAVALALAVSLLPLAAAWDRAIIRASVPPHAIRPRYSDVFRGKAGTAVLNALGYAFGGGGYGVWIARTTGCGAGVAAGIVFFIITSDLAAVALLATPAAWLADSRVGIVPALRIGAPAVALTIVGLALVGPLRRPVAGSDEGAAGMQAPGRRAGPVAALTSIFGRCTNIGLILVATWVGARAFGMPLPFTSVAIYMPIVLLVGSLPINVLGIGPVTGIWLLAFDRYAPPEQVIAFQFLWQLFFGAGIVVRGLPFVRRVVAEIDEGKARPQSSTAAAA